MTRIEPVQVASKKSHSFIKSVGKFFYGLIRLPFKITFRFLFVLILLIIFLYVVRTGVWHVPVVSEIVYHEPQPLHSVEPEIYSSGLLVIRSQEALLTSSHQGAELIISEGELTSLVQQSILSESNALTDVIVSITESSVEIFGRVTQKPEIIIRARVIPYIKESQLAFTIDSVYIGQSRIPKGLLSSNVLSWITPPLFDQLLSTMSIQSIELQDSKLTLSLAAL